MVVCSDPALAVYWIAYALGVVTGALGMFACATRRSVKRGMIR